MSVPPAPGPAFTRRSLLTGSAAGLALLVAGCTPSSAGRKDDAATSRQADALARQVPVQQSVVAAYAAAQAADATLGSRTAQLASQAAQQLARLEAAAPGSARSGTSGSKAAASPSAASPSGAAVPAGQDPQAWLRAQVRAAADAHAAACATQSGARAALLGSIAAGLRGQAAALS